ncbi:MAG: hypothetical protein ABI723_07425 [Bacteroidia bacterium]
MKIIKTGRNLKLAEFTLEKERVVTGSCSYLGKEWDYQQWSKPDKKNLFTLILFNPGKSTEIIAVCECNPGYDAVGSIIHRFIDEVILTLGRN